MNHQRWKTTKLKPVNASNVKSFMELRHFTMFYNIKARWKKKESTTGRVRPITPLRPEINRKVYTCWLLKTTRKNRKLTTKTESWYLWTGTIRILIRFWNFIFRSTFQSECSFTKKKGGVVEPRSLEPTTPSTGYGSVSKKKNVV